MKNRIIENVLKVAVWSLVLLSFTAITFAQGGASLTGRVTDENGANIAGAEVHLQLRSGVTLLARTNQEGIYGFNGLGSGKYILQVKARGFSNSPTSLLDVENGKKLTSDVQLSVAGLSESVVVTATGTAQSGNEVGKAVTVLNQQEIENRRELTLADALRGTPGLRVQQLGSPGALTAIRLRGQRNSDTALLLDGLRVRDASDINGSALPFLTDIVPVGLDRVEILRGSGSSIYGTNAIGGVVNLLPATGSGSPRFKAGFEGGNLSLFRERFNGSGGIGSRAGFSFGLSRIDVRRGVDGNDEYGNTAGVGRFTFNATPSISIGANFYATMSNARVNSSPFALPGAFIPGVQNPDAIAGVTFQPDFNNPDQGRRNRLFFGSVKFAQLVNEVFSYTLAYSHGVSRRRNYDGPLVDPRYTAFVPFGDFEFNSTNNGSTDTFDARANFQISESNLITAGFEFERESLFQLFESAFGAATGTNDRQRTLAVFGQDQFVALDGRLTLSFGVRGQFYSLRPADRPGFLQDIDTESSVTGDGAISFLVRQTGTKLRAHVGNGFRAPSLFERFGQGTFTGIGFARFGDPTIKPEQSISVDGGFDQRLSGNRVKFGMTYFYTRLQRSIVFTGFAGPFSPTAPPDPLGLGRSSGYLNGNGGIARGIESYFETSPLRGMNLHATYTFTNSDRFVPSLGLQSEYVIPKHLLGLDLSQRYRSFLISFDLNHTGSYIAPIFESDFPFRSADLLFDGYTKADLFGSYEYPFSERTRMVLFLGAENIFNETYYENGFRAPGVMGRGGVKVQF